MKIIVIQRHVENLRGIKECVALIDAKRADEIMFTSDPWEVEEWVADRVPAFVVSGQIFDTYLIDGTGLARKVKSRNSQSLFFIYSTMPETSLFVDGVIPKACGTAVSLQHSLLARILAGPLDVDTVKKSVLGSRMGHNE